MIPAQRSGAGGLAVESLGEGVDVVLVGHQVGGEAAVDVPAGEGGLETEVLPALPAVPALFTRLCEPGHPDALAHLEGVAPGAE